MFFISDVSFLSSCLTVILSYFFSCLFVHFMFYFEICKENKLVFGVALTLVCWRCLGFSFNKNALSAFSSDKKQRKQINSLSS